STFTVNNPGAVTYGANTGFTGGFITGNLALVKTGLGTFTIASRPNTYTGGTTVNNGILQITAINAGNSALGTGPVVINAGATVETQVNGFGFTDGQSNSS